MAEKCASGTFIYGEEVSSRNWTTRTECEKHPPCCVCLGVIISILRYDDGSVGVHDWGWLSSTQLLTDPCLFFLGGRGPYPLEQMPQVPVQSTSNRRHIYFQYHGDESVINFNDNDRSIDRIRAQSCGEGFFLLLEDDQQPSEDLPHVPYPNISSEEIGPVVAAFNRGILYGGACQPLLYLPVHTSCLSVLDTFLAAPKASPTQVYSIEQAYDCWRTRLKLNKYGESSFNVMKTILEEEMQLLKPRSNYFTLWDAIWEHESESSEAEIDSDDDNRRPNLAVADLTIETCPDILDDTKPDAQSQPAERQEKWQEEENMENIVRDQLQSDPMANQDYTQALMACAPFLSIETPIIQTTKLQQRLNNLPRELFDRIFEHVSTPSIPSSISIQCNRLLPSSTWMNWLSSGELIPYLWDLTKDQISKINSDEIDWEKLFRLLAQDELITVDHALTSMPPGFKNRRRIWQNLQKLRPNEIPFISAPQYREGFKAEDGYDELKRLFRPHFLDKAELQEEQSICKDEGHISLELEWIKGPNHLYEGGHWLMNWHHVNPRENT